MNEHEKFQALTEEQKEQVKMRVEAILKFDNWSLWNLEMLYKETHPKSLFPEESR